MTAIYKRELNSYFNSMVGYVFIAVLICIVGFYFMIINMYNGYPYFSYTLQSASFVFMVAVPILTMKSMAEDRRSKTDQLLLTSPVSLTSLVIGKYLAMVSVLAVPVLIFCLCPLIIHISGASALLSDYSSILAFFLMGCVYVAVGMFISALTESQIIAAVGTFAILLVLNLWDALVGYLPDAVSNILALFSFTSVFNNFASYQVFDVGGLVLYLSIAFIFVFLTIQTLQKRRWS